MKAVVTRTAAWIGLVFAVGWIWLFAILKSESGTGLVPLTLVLAAVVVGGPAAIALGALRDRMPVTAAAFGVLTVVLAIAAVGLSTEMLKEHRRTPASSTQQGGCADRSGGAGECPGG